MSRRDRSEGQLFIGRLGKNCRNSDLEDVFEPYGRLLRCEIKYGAEMAYGFVDYEDRRDAEDAIKYENGREVAGSAIIVEWAKGTPRRGGGGSSRDMRDSRGSRSTDDCYRCRRTGHWARDCPDDRQYGYRRPSRRSPRRSSYRSRSRSRDRDRRRSRSRSRDRRRRRSRSRSRSRRSRSRSYDRKRSASKSRSRSRSRSRSYGHKRSESKSRSRSRSRSRSADRGHDDDVNGDDRSKSGSRSPDRQKSASPS